VGRRANRRRGKKKYQEFTESEDEMRKEDKVNKKCNDIDGRMSKMGEATRL
jgi:hypothetical protein